jgi:hypothetical protein
MPGPCSTAAGLVLIGFSVGFGVGFGGGVGVASGAAGPVDVCAPAVDAVLRQYGLSLETIVDARFRVYHVQDDPFMAEDDRPISGYGFYGRPSVCAGGSIAIDMWDNCAVTDIRTRGDCRIPGIRHGWL